ncbi:DUF7619 domain-containing protein [Flavobacterium sp.]|uniref:DUF7849 domain-containing protein n=1 Tax=Flavobacterium sp. TaxID=239 RepID=UPI003D0E65AA
MTKFFTSICLLGYSLLFGQVTSKDTVTRKASITFEKKGNQVFFVPQVPPLLQISGAPKAYYSYFWELGDGNYSREEKPKHVYKKTPKKVNLSVTNNYDYGKPPKTRPISFTIDEITELQYTELASLQDTVQIKMFNTREPVPEEEMIVVVSYKNPLDYVASGKLYLFYNDKEFKNDNFQLQEARTYFDEKEVIEDGLTVHSNSTNQYWKDLADQDSNRLFKNDFIKEDNLDITLLDAKTNFKNYKVFEVNAVNPNETRNVFFSFKTTPEMIKDTTATVRMRSVYVPDRSYKNHKKKTLEMQIVTSHDPNKMSSNATFMNYRLVRFKKLKFKTQFQNDGEGPARTIRLETDIPDMFDKRTLEILDSYPQCPICPKNEEVRYSCLDTIIKQKQIHFTFKNIYLPGSNQTNVTEKDSTKGFVRYTLKFTKDFHKIKTKSKTAIFFDKNEPVITNYAVTRFKPGLSIGGKVGYNFFPKLENSKSYFTSVTFSPYKSYRWYWQAEWQNSLHQFNSAATVSESSIVGNNGVKQLQRITTQSNTKQITMEIPVLARYNINNYVGLGAGMTMGVNVSAKETVNTTKETFESGRSVLLNTKSDQQENDKGFSTFQSGMLVEITAGFARIGPSLGARYVFNFQKDFNYVQLYGIWKF